MADKRDILIRLLGEETVARMADRAGDGLDRFGHKLDATEKDAKHLDRQIGEVEGNLKLLATAFARTNDAADRVDITKAIRRQQTELRKLTKAKDLLPDFNKEGEEAASGFVASFGGRLGPLMAKMPVGPVGLAVGAVIAAAVAPVVATAISGAVLGGVGAGGVVGGIALAAKDSRVQAAGKQLGDHIMGDLESSATRFVSPTIRGIQIIGNAWNDVSDDIDGFLAATSRYVEPLARGLGGMIRELAPGLRKAAEAAGPVIRVIGEELPQMGKALGSLFSTIADNAGEGAGALQFVFRVLEGGIYVVGGLIDMFAGMYRGLLDVADVALTVGDALLGWVPVVGDLIDGNLKNIHDMKAALEESGDAGGQAGSKIEGGLRKVDTAATGAGVKVRSLQEIMDDFANNTLDARAATRQFEQAVDDADDAVKKNGKTLNDHTAKGRANKEALDAIARAALRERDATLKATGSQEQANAVTERGRAAFIRAATAMGMSASKAAALARTLFGIPNVNRTVTVNNKQALSAISRVQQGINGLHGKDLRVGVYYTKHGDLKLPGGTQLKGLAHGGPVIGSGPKGVDSEPRLLAPGEFVLDTATVDAMGGTSAVERFRSMLRGPARQLASSTAWGPPPSAGQVANHYTINVNVAPGASPAEVGRQTVEAIKAYERSSGKVWVRA